MSDALNEQHTKPLHEICQLVVGNCYQQIMGEDVAAPYVIGAPGGGKTASLQALCETNYWGIVSTHFALKPLEETGGIPQFETFVVGGQEILGTTWSFPDIMKSLFLESERIINLHNTMFKEKKLARKNPMVIWLLDDMHLCSAVHNAMLYELLTERKLREYKIPKNVAIVLAGNHASSKAGAKVMFSAIVNRSALFPVHTSFDYWKKHFAIPNGIHPAVMSFLENDQYNQFFHETEQVDVPWGSPRSWSRLSNMISTHEKWYSKSMAEDLTLYVATAHVGKVGASEFANYYHIFSKFDIPAILAASEKFELPDNPVDRYALAYALTSDFAGRKDRKNISEAFSRILFKYIKDHADLGLMVVHEILNIEKILNKRDLYLTVANHLNNFEPGITENLIAEVTDV